MVLVTVLAGGLLMAAPAWAGNWEETLLDPTPPRIEPGVTYTFGYWVLQHGSYPFMGGDLGPTALVATEKGGDAVEFAGTPGRTPGHYSAEVVFPHEGTWTIGSKHGKIMPDMLVATVTVPGSVEVEPSVMKQRAPYEWGTVRPSFPPSAPDARMAGPAAGPESGAASASEPASAVEPRSRATVDEPGRSLPWAVAVLAGALTVGFAVWLGRRYARSNR